ncbi:uncharacterized protein AMSG_01448 [Thecamonas trahens ATCC 50062]|uniref:Clathrin light chain n=1 Tax=Thecamonas trahens ATCC 50062 TaxID=461836 RepID=A0A0L0DQM6_THETB|nr:hypothetical protein AMSG_01448 [Thecamonas trahens ATCC 50062]KNC54592.1 hypothetical protein AMSG_01448 [Thecamonas trahens ATCC 50062]|eukprot:XP_013761501.1 hypothetical protein AMSG_01448 [Thecamonas trahens ATCC 50062]
MFGGGASADAAPASSPFMAAASSSNGIGDDEPAPLKEWKAERAQLISSLEAEAKATKTANAARAKEELAEFVAERTKVIGGTAKANRDAEEAGRENRENTVQPGEEWVRVNDLVDFSRKASSDVSRMRSLYISLKSNPPPAAALA